MPALVAGIHVFTTSQCNEDVDGRDGAPRALARGDPDKPGHDAEHVALFEPALDPIVAGVMQRKQRIVERHAGVRGDRRAGEVAKRRKLGDRGHVIVDAMIARCRASR